YATKPVSPQGAMVSNQPCVDLGVLFATHKHCLHEVVVRVGFIGKAVAVPVNSYHAWFCAINKVRHDADGAVLTGYNGDGHPCGRMGDGVVYLAPHSLAHT